MSPAPPGNLLKRRVNPGHDLLAFLIAGLTLLFWRHLVGVQSIANGRPNGYVVV